MNYIETRNPREPPQWGKKSPNCRLRLCTLYAIFHRRYICILINQANFFTNLLAPGSNTTQKNVFPSSLCRLIYKHNI